MPSTFQQKLSLRNRILMLGVMLAIGLGNICTERLTANDGLGWDGMTYAALASDFSELVFVQKVDEYRVGRILPCAIVHVGMRLVGARPTNHNIILAFDIYNFMLLMGCVYVWGLIAETLNLRTSAAWLGFCFLFLSYAILKNNFYAPVSTDTSAFALGILTLYFYLTRKNLGLIGVMIAGAFTWPTVPAMAALLYMFPRIENPGARPVAPLHRLNVWCAAIAATGVCAALLLLTGPLVQRLLATFPRFLRLNMSLLYLSIAATTVYVFFSVRAVLGEGKLFNLRAVWEELRWKSALVAVMLLIALKITTHLMANDVGPWATPKMFVGYILALSVSDPLLFFVAHVIYFGPVVIVLTLLWKPFCDSLSTFGIGLRLFVILNLALSLNSQSRQMINGLAVFVALMTMILDRRRLKSGEVVGWALLCLIYSKVWYVMNRGSQQWDGTMEDLLAFPLQHLYMNIGPWISHEMYLVQAGVVALTTAILYFLLRTRGHELKASADIGQNAAQAES
ncbi:MAG: hypothetical protein ABI779_04745 [Acidobacteriota bacterium]